MWYLLRSSLKPHLFEFQDSSDVTKNIHQVITDLQVFDHSILVYNSLCRIRSKEASWDVLIMNLEYHEDNGESNRLQKCGIIEPVEGIIFILNSFPTSSSF